MELYADYYIKQKCKECEEDYEVLSANAANRKYCDKCRIVAKKRNSLVSQTNAKRRRLLRAGSGIYHSSIFDKPKKI